MPKISYYEIGSLPKRMSLVISQLKFHNFSLVISFTGGIFIYPRVKLHEIITEREGRARDECSLCPMP